MSATTTQLLSSGEFCKSRYDTIPVKSESANVSFFTSNSKTPNFLVVTLVANERYVFVADRVVLGQDFLRILRFSSVSIIPPVFHAYPSSTCCYQKHKRSKPGYPPKHNAITDFYDINTGFSHSSGVPKGGFGC